MVAFTVPPKARVHGTLFVCGLNHDRFARVMQSRRDGWFFFLSLITHSFFCHSFVTKQGTTPSVDWISVAPGSVPSATSAARDQAGLEAATAHKDKLLAYAFSQAKRTSIVDDQSDFYDLFSSTDEAWLDPAERQVQTDGKFMYSKPVIASTFLPRVVY